MAKRISYHGSVLYEEDVALLRGWLTDLIIGWWLEVLEHDVLRDQAGLKQLAFLHPAAVAMLLFEEDPDDLASALRGLDLHAKSTIVLPLNDNLNPATAAAGAHWATLVIHRRSSGATHLGTATETELVAVLFDSAPGRSITAIARRAVAAIAPLISNNGTAGPPLAAPEIRIGKLQRQDDASSCGVYTCAIAEAVTLWHCSGDRSSLLDVAESLSPSDIRQYRTRMASIASGMMRAAI